MTARRKLRPQAGFTMIEVMLAIVITAIVVTGIIGLYKIEVTASSYSRHSSEATALAEDKIEKLRTLGAASAQSGTDTNVDPQDNTGGIFTRTWTETVLTGYATITVTVTWSDDGVAHTLTVYARRGL